MKFSKFFFSVWFFKIKITQLFRERQSTTGVTKNSCPGNKHTQVSVNYTHMDTGVLVVNLHKAASNVHRTF